MFNAAGRPLAIAFLVAGAFFMENLDGTVIATTLPQMAESFRAGPASLNVGMTAYMLTLAVFIPMSGWGLIDSGHVACSARRLAYLLPLPPFAD
jgi:MFS family permease